MPFSQLGSEDVKRKATKRFWHIIKSSLTILFTGTDVHVSEAEWQLLKNFSANFDSHLSSVSDYVPAAISCQDSQTMINARVY